MLVDSRSEVFKDVSAITGACGLLVNGGGCRPCKSLVKGGVRESSSCRVIDRNGLPPQFHRDRQGLQTHARLSAQGWGGGPRCAGSLHSCTRDVSDTRNQIWLCIYQSLHLQLVLIVCPAAAAQYFAHWIVGGKTRPIRQSRPPPPPPPPKKNETRILVPPTRSFIRVGTSIQSIPCVHVPAVRAIVNSSLVLVS